MKNPNEVNLWVGLYALAIQDPMCIVKYARSKHILNKQPFYKLTQLCARDMGSDYRKALRAKSGTLWVDLYALAMQDPMYTVTYISLYTKRN